MNLVSKFIEFLEEHNESAFCSHEIHNYVLGKKVDYPVLDK